MHKTKEAFALLRHVLMALGFVEKPTSKSINEKNEYAIDGTVNKVFRIYTKTGIIASELISRLKDEIGLTADPTATKESFGLVSVSITHLLKLEDSIIKKLGPIKEPPQKPSAVVLPLTEVFQKLKAAGMPIKSYTGDTNQNWAIYFETPDVGVSAFAFLKKIFGETKVRYTPGQKAVKINKSTVITKSRTKKATSATQPVERKKATGKKNDLEAFTQQITKDVVKSATEFIVQQTSDFETGYLAKLQKSYHLIQKKKQEVKIPVKFLTMEKGVVSVPLDLFMKYLNKQ